MGKIWHSAGAMKALAAGLLALALAAIALNLLANRKWTAIQGPGALQAVSADAAWLGVDDEVWVLDRQGRRTATRSVRDLGFSESLSNIVPAPGNQVLLASRVDRDWQLVDAATLQRVRTIRPQWPDDIAKLPLNAVHVAVSPQGEIAASTGGGHTVLLFDGEGRLLARTAPDTYRFTNGLWWSAEGWWTTDTNRFALHLLDPATLAVRRTVQLRPEPAGNPFLGEAVASHGGPKAGGTQLPFATVSRLGTLMERGQVVDVFPDGSQDPYNLDTTAQLRDLAWFGAHLLVVDGDSYELRRFDADRIAVQPFGDATVQAALAARLQERNGWRLAASRLSKLAALLFALGLGAYARHRQVLARSGEEVLNGPAVDWLRAPAEFDRIKLDGEAPREAVYLPGRRPRWLLVTNRRVLLFAGPPEARKLVSEWPRRAVVFAGTPDQLGGQGSFWQRLLNPANLVLTFTTGTTLHLRCASPATALRVAQLLMSSPALPDEFGTIVVPLRVQSRWHEVLASFVVPGAGQWLQGRFATGTALFTAALLLALFGWWPVVWALHGPKMEVSTASIAQAVIAWLLVPLVASSDAWRFSASRR